MKGYRSALIAAVAYSVVIGLIYVGLAVASLLVRACEINMEGSPYAFMLFLLYFRTGDCKANIRWEHLNIQGGVTADIPEDYTAATHRTYIFTIIYLALYGALIFTAFISLCGINNSCLGRKSFPVFFMPWILVCCSLVVMDVVATTYYIIDITRVWSTDGLMDLLEIGNPDQVRVVMNNLPLTTQLLPTITMFLITSKGFIFFIMDVVMIAIIIRAGWSAATYHKYVDDTIRHYSSNMSRTNPGFENSQTDIGPDKQQMKEIEYQTADVPSPKPASIQNHTPSRYNDTSVQAFVYPDRNAYKVENRPEEKQNSVPRPSSLALASRLNDRPPSQQSGNGQQDRDIDSRLSHYTTSNGSVIRSVEPLKDENISDRQQQQTRVRVLPMVAEINRNSNAEVNRSASEVKQRPKVPPKPQNPNRNSMQPWLNDGRRTERQDSQNSGAKVDRTSSVNTNDELRSQMPWSYFKPRDDVPKKAFTELDEGEDLPPVPIPDYTLHFPKSKRMNLNDSDGDGSWNRHDQRY